MPCFSQLFFHWPTTIFREPFTPSESESFDIRDWRGARNRSSQCTRWIRVLVYVLVSLAVVIWFALRVAGTLD